MSFDFNNLNITKIYVSKYLSHYEYYLKLKIKIKNNLNIPDDKHNILYFGLYDDFDIQLIKSQKGKKYLIFFGSDIEYVIQNNLISTIKSLQLSCIYTIFNTNNNIKLINIGIQNNFIILSNFTEIISKSKILKNNQKNKIFIYDGFCKQNGYIYGKNVIDILVEKITSNNNFSKYEIIFYSDLTEKNKNKFNSKLSMLETPSFLYKKNIFSFLYRNFKN